MSKWTEFEISENRPGYVRFRVTFLRSKTHIRFAVTMIFVLVSCHTNTCSTYTYPKIREMT
ncbi:hypothetical protein HLASF_3039 (plasmid) [Halanaeroarchaeum sulfurireducens]|uniref:Uncharacterized protein n=1 Tax=Halanaeroarchaeum sulfurireducens TaxID=1604004 RepID=A0A0F7PEP1_9EURY|nr:hypothetical protein HLASF_3039 [Halanaeroarchaeum sulfurireducens]ALG83108.1 hypothetical protein HLASA_3040 [Halanaeroarchaeum sulfurireducens]